jgi:hypothetical protein
LYRWQIVVRMLNGVPLYGNLISLVISSHMMVKLPRPGTEEVRPRAAPAHLRMARVGMG